MNVTLEEAQARLAELIAAAARGEEVVVTQGNQPTAKIVAVPQPTAKPRPVFGSAKGVILHMADDFDAPLEEFKDYMP